ncbi:MAG: translation initiation factor IF-3 [Anaerohalosphaera sp.]|nr:translation initiation factor IF-3 [Anaerohalosphaera sp.]
MSKQNLRINERIRVNNIRLVDEKGEQVGIVSADEGLSRAKQISLDLVEVSPDAEPPVCRIMDFGKWLYDQKRKSKQSHKKQHVTTLKEIRLRPKIDPHDRDIKIKHAIKFLEKGHKVQFTMLFRGREMMHVDIGYKIMEEVVETLEDYAKIERDAKMLGRRITLVVTPK